MCVKVIYINVVKQCDFRDTLLSPVWLQRSLPMLRQMTPDIEAFIQESLQPQGSTQAAATASKTLTAVVLRPPLSTAANTVSSSAASKTTVISLSQTPLSKAGMVIFYLFFA